MARDIETRPMYIPPSRMTQLMGVAGAANGNGAYDLMPVNVPDYETGSAIEKLDAAITGDSTERVIAEIDALMEALEANRTALVESRNEQISSRNSLAVELKATYEKMRAIIPKVSESYLQLQTADLELRIAKALLDSMREMRAKVINEAEDPNAALAPAEVLAAHDKAAEMLRQEGPVLYDVTEKKEWLDLCTADFNLIAEKVKDIFDEEQRIFTAFQLLRQEVQVDAAAKDQTAKRIGKAAVLVARKTGRDWFGRKSKRLIDTTARTITNNAGPSVTVRREHETEEGNEV